MVNYQSLTCNLALTQFHGLWDGSLDHLLFQNDFINGGWPKDAGGGPRIADLG